MQIFLRFHDSLEYWISEIKRLDNGLPNLCNILQLIQEIRQPSSWSLASWFAFPINPACLFKIPSYSHPWEVWNMHVYWRSESNWEFFTLSFALYHTILFSRFVQLHKICDIVFGFFINIDLACIILQIPVYSIIRSSLFC